MNKAKHAKFALKVVVFSAITAICVFLLQNILVPVYPYTDMWPTTSTYKNFYELEKDSVDVLFLGSSHSVSYFNPLLLYDDYGIVSYNLGCEQQSMVLSYYWLKEAVKYQSPQAVVIDTYLLHQYEDAYVYTDLNCSEATVRKAVDCMRMSPVKLELIRDICELDPKQTMMSFFMKNVRFHSRWTELSESDFTERSMMEHGALRGFTPMFQKYPGYEYTPFHAGDSAEIEPIVETMGDYLDKIVELCNEQDIELILVSVPGNGGIERYNAVSQYAEQRNLDYYDFNEAFCYNVTNYDMAEDSLFHGNVWGAQKITDFIGKLLSEQYNVQTREDPSFDRTRELYENVMHDYDLISATDLEEYLDLATKEDLSVFVFIPKGLSFTISDDAAEKFAALGFATDLRTVGDEDHYYGVKDSEGIVEELTDIDFCYKGTTRGGLTPYEFMIDTTFMAENSHTYSMKIDGMECGNEKPGIHFAVYDNDLQRVIDAVTFREKNGSIVGIR